MQTQRSVAKKFYFEKFKVKKSKLALYIKTIKLAKKNKKIRKIDFKSIGKAILKNRRNKPWLLKLRSLKLLKKKLKIIYINYNKKGYYINKYIKSLKTSINFRNLYTSNYW